MTYKPSKHEHEQGAPLGSDCDQWCRSKHESWLKRQPKKISLWVAETNLCYMMVTFAETEEEARKKFEAEIKDDSKEIIACIDKCEEGVVHV